MYYIYHYTSVESLLGMLHAPTPEEKEEIGVNGNNLDYGYYLEFHASDLNLMNDKKENFLLKVIADDIQSELKPVCEFAKWIEGQAYCVSFCTEPDYIPMWKIYAANNPICLKFKVEGLNDAIQNVNKSSFVETYMQECTYVSEKEFKERVENYKKELLEFKITDGKKAAFPKLIEIIHDSAFLKLDSFKYEKECRIAAFVNNPAKCKQGRYGISLYYPIKIPLRFLEEIIIGPSVNQDILEYSVIQLLKSKRYEKLKKYTIKVTKTSIELRYNY